jgi:hypothetical protein
MMAMHFHSNLLALLVAVVATFAIGALWYSPLLFGNMWVRAHGYSPERLERMKKGAPRAYGFSFVAFLVMAHVFAFLAMRVGVGSALGGAKLGLTLWVGFALTIGLTAWVYSDKPVTTYLIDAGYQLVYLLIMGAIIGGWR